MFDNDQLQLIKSEHPNWGYKRIASAMGVSHNCIRYHTSEHAKNKTKERHATWKKKHPLEDKLHRFIHAATKANLRNRLKRFSCTQKKPKRNKRMRVKQAIKFREFVNKIISHPACYLTGRPIDINNTASYSLDHITPFSRGGSADIENCGLATRQANSAKSDMTIDEFLCLCRDVLTHHGFKITK